MRRNVEELADVADLLRDAGVHIWEVFFLIAVGRGADCEELSPQQHEDVCHWLVDVARRGVVVRTVEAPFFRRVAVQRTESGADDVGQAFGLGPLYGRLAARLEALLGGPTRPAAAPTAGTRDGHGIIFVAHNGDVYPSGFLPVSLGNVRTASLVDLYRDHPLLHAIRRAEFSGRCGECRFADLCGGSRARAYARTGNPLASDPACPYLVDAGIAGRQRALIRAGTRPAPGRRPWDPAAGTPHSGERQTGPRAAGASGEPPRYRSTNSGFVQARSPLRTHHLDAEEALPSPQREAGVSERRVLGDDPFAPPPVAHEPDLAGAGRTDADLDGLPVDGHVVQHGPGGRVERAVGERLDDGVRGQGARPQHRPRPPAVAPPPVRVVVGDAEQRLARGEAVVPVHAAVALGDVHIHVGVVDLEPDDAVERQQVVDHEVAPVRVRDEHDGAGAAQPVHDLLRRQGVAGRDVPGRSIMPSSPIPTM